MTIEAEQYGDERRMFITKKVKQTITKKYYTHIHTNIRLNDFYDNYGCIYELKKVVVFQ
jgi:hypothetical protein